MNLDMLGIAKLIALCAALLWAAVFILAPAAAALNAHETLLEAVKLPFSN